MTTFGKTIVEEGDLNELSNLHDCLIKDPIEKETVLDSCIRYGSIKEGAVAGENVLHALFADNGKEDSSPIFQWIDALIEDKTVFGLEKDMTVAISDARKAFDKLMVGYRREGWLPQAYDVEWAFRGAIGVVLCTIHDRFYEKFDNLQQIGTDAFYKTSGLFSKKYNIIALQQYDNMRLDDIEPEGKYSRYDVAAIVCHVCDRNKLTEDVLLKHQRHIKDLLKANTGNLISVKQQLEAEATSRELRDIYAYLYTACVIEALLGKH